MNNNTISDGVSIDTEGATRQDTSIFWQWRIQNRWRLSCLEGDMDPKDDHELRHVLGLVISRHYTGSPADLKLESATQGIVELLRGPRALDPVP